MVRIVLPAQVAVMIVVASTIPSDRHHESRGKKQFSDDIVSDLLLGVNEIG